MSTHSIFIESIASKKIHSMIHMIIYNLNWNFMCFNGILVYQELSFRMFCSIQHFKVKLFCCFFYFIICCVFGKSTRAFEKCWLDDLTKNSYVNDGFCAKVIDIMSLQCNVVGILNLDINSNQLYTYTSMIFEAHYQFINCVEHFIQVGALHISISIQTDIDIISKLIFKLILFRNCNSKTLFC